MLLLIFELEKQILTGELGGLKSDHQYKFFTTLVLRLFHLKQSFGAGIYPALKYIKQWVAADYFYEQKIREIFWGGIFQMISIMVILTIFFWVMAAELGLTIFPFISLWSMQLFGILCYLLGYTILVKKTFYLFDYLFLTILNLRSFIGLGDDCQKLMQEFRIYQFLQLKIRRFDQIQLKLQQVTKRIQDIGTVEIDQLDDILSDCWNLYKQRHRLFEQQISLLKFFILAIFFLGSYLYHLLVLVSQLQLEF